MKNQSNCYRGPAPRDIDSDSIAYGLVAKFQFVSEFPGCDELGLNPDKPKDKIIAEAIIHAILSGVGWNEYGESTHAFGYLSAMIYYRIVDPADVIRAWDTLRRRKLSEIPMHDAY